MHGRVPSVRDEMGRRAACVVEMAAENSGDNTYGSVMHGVQCTMYNVLYNVDTLGRRRKEYRKEYRKECGEGQVQAGDARGRGTDIHSNSLSLFFTTCHARV